MEYLVFRFYRSASTLSQRSHSMVKPSAFLHFLSVSSSLSPSSLAASLVSTQALAKSTHPLFSTTSSATVTESKLATKMVIHNNLDPSKSKLEPVDILRQQKQALRKEIRSRIRAAYSTGNEPDEKLFIESSNVFSRLFSLPQYQSAKSIGLFLSMPSGEIQTHDAIKKIVGDGKTLYVPRVGLDFEECDMDLIRAETDSPTEDDGMFYDKWPKNKWGIPEPPFSDDEVSKSLIAQPGDIDVLLVPGLAFDSKGHRMGQGKGYYDRFIAKMRDREGGDEKKPLLVGICLEEQFLEVEGYNKNDDEKLRNIEGGVPVADHDYIMDIILSPSKLLVVSKQAELV
mmetsp:Transcript_14062/g.28663  ORF Transcript_14062/g.28663 Transcript_14062/m.28663 type:complete len:342 (-) Transcript_14062:65-1090(-)